jgi:hypothetical protein
LLYARALPLDLLSSLETPTGSSQQNSNAFASELAIKRQLNSSAGGRSAPQESNKFILTWIAAFAAMTPRESFAVH